MPRGRPSLTGGSAPATKGSTLDIGALTAKWYELRGVDKADTEGQADLRKVLSMLRRVTHTDIHPDCPDVEIDVPPHSSGTVFAIGNTSQRLVFRGRCIMPRCRAQTILDMIAKDRLTEGRRLSAGGGVLRETGRISDIARQITEA